MLSQSNSGALGIHVNCPQYTLTTQCCLNVNNPYMRAYAFVRDATGLNLRSMRMRDVGPTICALDRPYVCGDSS